MQVGETAYRFEEEKSVVLIVGVNGVGKTTSVGKLAGKLKDAGKESDTCGGGYIPRGGRRAANRMGEPCRRGDDRRPGGKQTRRQSFMTRLRRQKQETRTSLLCDTAGRLHNKKNLMEELRKINRILEKEYPDAYRETLVVLDATTGQNALAAGKTVRGSGEI